MSSFPLDQSSNRFPSANNRAKHRIRGSGPDIPSCSRLNTLCSLTPVNRRPRTTIGGTRPSFHAAKPPLTAQLPPVRINSVLVRPYFGLHRSPSITSFGLDSFQLACIDATCCLPCGPHTHTTSPSTYNTCQLPPSLLPSPPTLPRLWPACATASLNRRTGQLLPTKETRVLPRRHRCICTPRHRLRGRFPLGDAKGGSVVGVPRALEERDEALRHREGEDQLRAHDDDLGRLPRRAGLFSGGTPA